MKPCRTKLNVLKTPFVALAALCFASAAVANASMDEQTSTIPGIEITGTVTGTFEAFSDACNATLSSNGILAIEQRRTQSIAGLLDSRIPGNTVNGPLLDLTENFSVFERRALRTRAGTYLHRTSKSALDSDCEVS